MGFDHVHHAIELKVIFGHVTGIHVSAEALFVMAAIDPAIVYPVFVCRSMIMKHALCRVQYFVFFDSTAF